MPKLNTPLPATTAPSPTQRIAWGVLIALTLYICYFSHLDVIGLIGPDEPRYAWIARDMAESGDWITPRLYGRPWFEKPPLLYWGGAVFFNLMPARPEIAARLPSAISALLATLALAWLAWRSYGEECVRWLLLLLPTSVGMIGFSHACATDMPFAGMLAIALVCASVIFGLVPPTDRTPVLPRTCWLALVLFGFFEGLAVLAKGPAALILTGGAVFIWALFTKRWRDAFRLFHPAAIAVFCLTALPWYILCARRNPDFFRIFIIEHNLKRYFTPEFQHNQSFWFYLPILVLAFIPWIGLIVWALVSALLRHQRTARVSPLTLLLVTFAVFGLLFFSVSKSKLPGYILPSIPPLALLLSRSLQLLAEPLRRSLRLAMLSTGTILVLASFALFFKAVLPVHHSVTKELLTGAVGILTFALSLPNFLLMSAMRKAVVDPTKSTPGNLFVIPVLLVLLFAGKFVSFLMPVDSSGRTIGQELVQHNVPATALSVQNMNRGTHYSLNFYTRTEIADWDPLRPTTGYLLLAGRFCDIVAGQNTVCEEPPIYLGNSKRFLYRVTRRDSFPGASSGRQLQ